MGRPSKRDAPMFLLLRVSSFQRRWKSARGGLVEMAYSSKTPDRPLGKLSLCAIESSDPQRAKEGSLHRLCFLPHSVILSARDVGTPTH